MIKELNPLQAWDFMQKNPKGVLVDVRTRIEYSHVGHPTGSINIVWKEAPEWRINPAFVDEVKKVVTDTQTPLLLLCRSGQRSMDAAKELEKAGFQQLINIKEGFEGALDGHKHRGKLGGWRFHGLPWEQS